MEPLATARFHGIENAPVANYGTAAGPVATATFSPNGRCGLLTSPGSFTFAVYACTGRVVVVVLIGAGAALFTGVSVIGGIPPFSFIGTVAGGFNDLRKRVLIRQKRECEEPEKGRAKEKQ